MTARFAWFLVGWSIMVALVFERPWWFYVGMGFAGAMIWNGLVNHDD